MPPLNKRRPQINAALLFEKKGINTALKSTLRQKIISDSLFDLETMQKSSVVQEATQNAIDNGADATKMIRPAWHPVFTDKYGKKLPTPDWYP
uniref:Uncharacterized protein n=1 Tax=Romanomermis culicivorax TaxID=13658 RepID=A0A915HTP4_ROMCU